MKYNRYTPENMQKNLSIESKIEYILRFGDLKDIIKITKNKFDLMKKVFYERTKKDIMISDKSKHFLEHLIHLKEKNGDNPR